MKLKKVAESSKLQFNQEFVWMNLWVCVRAIGHCDQIGRFLEVLGNKFDDKSSLKRLVTFGLFLKRITSCKNAVVTIWATFGNSWAIFLLQYLVTLLTALCHFDSIARCHLMKNRRVGLSVARADLIGRRYKKNFQQIICSTVCCRPDCLLRVRLVNAPQPN